MAIGSSFSNVTKITLKEAAAADVPTPPAGKQYIFIDSTSHALNGKNSAGTAAAIGGGMTNPMTTAGDVIFGGASGTPTRLAIGTAAQVLKVNAGATAPEWGTAASGGADYILIEDQKASTTPGGTLTANTWVTRDLNTEQSDTGGHASVASNQITLAAGTYEIEASCPGYYCGFHKARLYNVTDTAVALVGTSEISYTTASIAGNCSFIKGKITIAASKVLELQHFCTVTHATYGAGAPTGAASTVEVYSQILLSKVA